MIEGTRKTLLIRGKNIVASQSVVLWTSEGVSAPLVSWPECFEFHNPKVGTPKALFVKDEQQSLPQLMVWTNNAKTSQDDFSCWLSAQKDRNIESNK